MLLYNGATNHGAAVEHYGAMPLGAVLFYNGAVACGAVLWIHFWDSFPQGLNVEFLLKRNQNAKIISILPSLPVYGTDASCRPAILLDFITPIAET